MSTGCLYTDLDRLRDDYNYKISRYIDELNGVCKNRDLKEKKLFEYTRAKEQLDRVIIYYNYNFLGE